MSDQRINLADVRRRAQEAVAVKGDGAIAMSRRAGKDVLALVEAVEAAQEFYDGDQRDNARLDSALARFDFPVAPAATSDPDKQSGASDEGNESGAGATALARFDFGPRP